MHNGGPIDLNVKSRMIIPVCPLRAVGDRAYASKAAQGLPVLEVQLFIAKSVESVILNEKPELFVAVPASPH